MIGRRSPRTTKYVFRFPNCHITKLLTAGDISLWQYHGVRQLLKFCRTSAIMRGQANPLSTTTHVPSHRHHKANISLVYGKLTSSLPPLSQVYRCTLTNRWEQTCCIDLR